MVGITKNSKTFPINNKLPRLLYVGAKGKDGKIYKLRIRPGVSLIDKAVWNQVSHTDFLVRLKKRKELVIASDDDIKNASVNSKGEPKELDTSYTGESHTVGNTKVDQIESGLVSPSDSTEDGGEF